VRLTPSDRHLPHTARRLAVLLALVCSLAAAAAPGAGAVTVNELLLVANSGAKDYGELENISYRPAISADGRWVAWVAPTFEEATPLYLRDLDSGVTRTVTPPSAPPTDAGSVRGYDSETPVLSADGRYLAYASEWNGALGGTGAKPSGPETQQNVYVYDRATGRIRLVSRRSGPEGRVATADSSRPSISEGGGTVAYSTASHNLSPPGPLRYGGVYERDLRTERNRVVSALPGVDGWIPGSFFPDISGDGRRVAFGYRDNIRDPYDPAHPPRNPFRWERGEVKEVMLWDPRWKRPRLVSRGKGPRGTLPNGRCVEASASRTGRYVAFTCAASNLVPGDDNGADDVFVRDVVSDTTVLVSSPTRKPIADGDSSRPSISADGRYVAFQSTADNLVPGDADTKSDVFVKDLQTGALTEVSAADAPESSNGRSAEPVITPDGRFVVFASTSSNLSPENATHFFSIYRARLGP
jgi:Tol biopolymer transport system component